MRVLVTGAAGMIGRKLTARLAVDGHLGGKALTALILHDIVAPPRPDVAIPVIDLASDFADLATAEELIGHRPDVVFHLAGVVSGTAEANFDLGYAVNLDGTRRLFDAIRLSGLHPRVVYASTAAVFGGPFPDVVPDDFAPTPLSSYGSQKLIGEVILSDYTRRGFMDGVGLRLPTICVRPGKPNGAASSFFSGIIREPLNGQPAALPVHRDWVHTHASPRAAVGFFIHAGSMDTSPVGSRRNLVMPGTSVSVGEQIASLTRIAGPRVAALIHEAQDPAVWAIVKTWPQRFAATRARDLGFVAETSFDEIIEAYITEELGGRLPEFA
ncbi:MAG: SDR family oxidoreductase [Rhodobacterales bacterium]|nr:SDR family oxidoreductase [Rhodobacterales bacterium]